MHAADLLTNRARLTPDREAMLMLPAGRRYTYAELNARANRLANWMRALGVEKAIMAPQVTTARSKAAEPVPDTGPLSQPASPAEQALAEIRRKVEAKAEDVGESFAVEARAIHDGSKPERSIIGQARPDEAKALIEDGIPVYPLPWGNRRTN